MKYGRTLTALFAIIVMSLVATSITATETVSPGAADRIAIVEGRCPTFSWGFVPDALAYELVAYRMPEGEARELGSEDEAMFASVTGSATSWTPSTEKCFDPGGRYVWFVRSVTEMVDDQVIEAGEWSAGRYFEVPAGPTPDELARALDVLKRWEATNGGGSPTLFAGAGSVAAVVPDADSDADADAGWAAPKSVPTASAAIRGEQPGTSGEVYGLVGTSASYDGAGVAAANLDGGPDLVLDGSADGVPDTAFSETGIDRISATQSTFTVQNSGAGRIDFEVVGDFFANTIDIEEIKIAGSTVVDDTGEWMGLGSTVPCASCVASSDIADGGVATADIADGAVDYQKIAIGNIRTGHLQNQAVNEDKIADGAVTGSKLAAGAVTSNVLRSDAVTNVHLADDAVTTAEILDGTITRHDLGVASVGAAAIANGSITTSELANGAVTGAKIATATVTAVNLADGSVGASKITNGAVTSSKIGALAVNEGNIQDWAVSTEKIEPSAVIGSKLADDAVWGAKIADGAVDSSHISNGTITAEDVNPTGGVYASKSAVYRVDVTETVSGGGLCNTATAACDDANDLPLSWYCFGNPNVGLRPIQLEDIYWDSLAAPAGFGCTYCNDSSSTQSFDAHIICVSVPGT